MITSSNDELQKERKKELQSWIENEVYIQVPYHWSTQNFHKMDLHK